MREYAQRTINKMQKGFKEYPVGIVCPFVIETEDTRECPTYEYCLVSCGQIFRNWKVQMERLVDSINKIHRSLTYRQGKIEDRWKCPCQLLDTNYVVHTFHEWLKED